MSLQYPVFTKVAGVCSGPEAETRQAALEELAGLRESDPELRVFLDLVPQPDNPYDADAMAVFANLPMLGRVQLGFIQNANTTCDFCHAQYERFPSKGCTRCGHKDQLRRDGLATRLAVELRAHPDTRIYAELQQITGGPEPDAEFHDQANNGVTIRVPGSGRVKSFGCNIALKQVYRKPGK